jgi:hypothetical protein
MADWVTAQITRTGGAVARKLQRLRDASDQSQPGSPAHLAYADFHRAWQNGDQNDRARLCREAEVEERE